MGALIADFRLAVLLMVRSRLWAVMVLLALLLAVSAGLAAQFSPRQPATVALDVGLSFIRLAVPFFGLLQVQDLLAREVERRQILTSLTFPRSRASFLLARYVAILAVASGVTMVLAVVLAAVVALISHSSQQATAVALGFPYGVTVVFLLLDFAVITAFAVAIATVATTPNLVLFIGLGFMVAARSASTIVRLLEREQDLLAGAEWYSRTLKGTQWAIPDLAALDLRPIALYGKMEFLPQEPWALIVMAIGYVVVLVIFGCFRFERRQFA